MKHFKETNVKEGTYVTADVWHAVSLVKLYKIVLKNCSTKVLKKNNRNDNDCQITIKPPMKLKTVIHNVKIQMLLSVNEGDNIPSHNQAFHCVDNRRNG